MNKQSSHFSSTAALRIDDTFVAAMIGSIRSLRTARNFVSVPLLVGTGRLTVSSYVRRGCEFPATRHGCPSPTRDLFLDPADENDSAGVRGR